MKPILSLNEKDFNYMDNLTDLDIILDLLKYADSDNTPDNITKTLDVNSEGYYGSSNNSIVIKRRMVACITIQDEKNTLKIYGYFNGEDATEAVNTVYGVVNDIRYIYNVSKKPPISYVELIEEPETEEPNDPESLF